MIPFRRIIQKVKKNSEQYKHDLFPVVHFSLVIECNLFGCTFYMMFRLGEICLTDPKSFILFVLFVTYKAILLCILLLNPYPTAFPYGNGMVLHFYQQQESSTTKTVHKVINKGLKTYV